MFFEYFHKKRLKNFISSRNDAISRFIVYFFSLYINNISYFLLSALLLHCYLCFAIWVKHYEQSNEHAVLSHYIYVKVIFKIDLFTSFHVFHVYIYIYIYSEPILAKLSNLVRELWWHQLFPAHWPEPHCWFCEYIYNIYIHTYT